MEPLQLGEWALFVIFASVSMVSAMVVVVQRSPMIAACFLALCLLALSGLFLLLSAPFLFLAQIMVYVGAIIVLFIFVIMLLGLRTPVPPLERLAGIKTVGALLVLAQLLLLASATAAKAPLVGGRAALPLGFGEPARLADLLFQRFLFPFELVSLLIIVGIVGVVLLTQAEEIK